MKYLKITWKHESADYPKYIFSELSDDRWELRKVELFPDGSYGFAQAGRESGKTQLAEVPYPPDGEISADAQFELSAITKQEFEDVWVKATSDG